MNSHHEGDSRPNANADSTHGLMRSSIPAALTAARADELIKALIAAGHTDHRERLLRGQPAEVLSRVLDTLPTDAVAAIRYQVLTHLGVANARTPSQKVRQHLDEVGEKLKTIDSKAELDRYVNGGPSMAELVEASKSPELHKHLADQINSISQPMRMIADHAPDTVQHRVQTLGSLFNAQGEPAEPCATDVTYQRGVWDRNRAFILADEKAPAKVSVISVTPLLTEVARGEVALSDDPRELAFQVRMRIEGFGDDIDLKEPLRAYFDKFSQVPGLSGTNIPPQMARTNEELKAFLGLDRNVLTNATFHEQTRVLKQARRWVHKGRPNPLDDVLTHVLTWRGHGNAGDAMTPADAPFGGPVYKDLPQLAQYHRHMTFDEQGRDAVEVRFYGFKKAVDVHAWLYTPLRAQFVPGQVVTETAFRIESEYLNRLTTEISFLIPDARLLD